MERGIDLWLFIIVCVWVCLRGGVNQGFEGTGHRGSANKSLVEAD